MKMNIQRTGGIAIVGVVIATLIVAIALADAPVLGQNNRVTTTYTNSTTIFTNIPGLSLTLIPNTVYLVTVSIIFGADGYAQFAVAPLPIGTTFRMCETQNTLYGSSHSAGCTIQTGTKFLGNPASDGTTYDDLALFTGTVVTGAVSGTFQMQGASVYAGYLLKVEVNSWIQAQVSSV